jgi:hypothetical protein
VLLLTMAAIPAAATVSLTQVRSHDFNRDIASGAEITASSYFPAFGPENTIVDDDSAWASGPINHGLDPDTLIEWIMFDFGSPQWIDTIVLLSRQPVADWTTAVRIEFGDGTTIEQGDLEQDDYNVISFPALQTNSVRIHITGGMNLTNPEGPSRFGFERVGIIRADAPAAAATPEPAVEQPAAPVEVQQPTSTPTPTDGGTAPQTTDPVVMVLAVLVLSSTACIIIVEQKKRKFSHR